MRRMQEEGDAVKKDILADVLIYGAILLFGWMPLVAVWAVFDWIFEKMPAAAVMLAIFGALVALGINEKSK